MRCALEVVALAAAAIASCRAAPATLAYDGSADAPLTYGAIDERTVKAMSHALFDAYDRADVDAVARALEPTCDLFDDGHLHEHEALLDEVRARRDRHAPSRTRKTAEEHVYLGDNSAVFIGETIEHYFPDGPKLTGDFDGWSTLVWVREAGGWRAAHWQWTRNVSPREEWNATYLEGRDVNPQPSQLLVDVVKGRTPGTALDVAMGQGRNTLYLASLGWRVTGFDISDIGIRMAQLAAAERKLHIEAIDTDEATYDYGSEKWDLVALFYTCCDGKQVENVRRSLKRGGLAVVEGFHEQPGARASVPSEQLAALKAGFTVLRDEVVDEVSDWGPRDVRQQLVQLVVQKP
jgi:hypothetical protein